MTLEEYEEGYHKFIQEASKHCGCCPECNDTPCDDVLAGAPCFGGCTCDEDYWYDDEY